VLDQVARWNAEGKVDAAACLLDQLRPVAAAVADAAVAAAALVASIPHFCPPFLQVKTDVGKVAAAAGLLEELRSKGDGDFQQTIDDMVAQVSDIACECA
jgi:hypothetical protein